LQTKTESVHLSISPSVQLITVPDEIKKSSLNKREKGSRVWYNAAGQSDQTLQMEDGDKSAGVKNKGKWYRVGSQGKRQEMEQGDIEKLQS